MDQMCGIFLAVVDYGIFSPIIKANKLNEARKVNSYDKLTATSCLLDISFQQAPLIAG